MRLNLINQPFRKAKGLTVDQSIQSSLFNIIFNMCQEISRDIKRYQEISRDIKRYQEISRDIKRY